MAMSTNDVCKIVTDKIIAEMEKGIIPWEKPWFAPGGFNGAFNRITKRPYSLLNQLLLGEPGEYASMKQWNELGGKIRKGEKANMVVFWKAYYKDVKAAETNEENNGTESGKKRVPFFVLRYYNVFHINQVEGVEPLDIKSEEEKLGEKLKPIKQAEHIMKAYTAHEKIHLSRGRSDQAYYAPITDKIVLPALKQFKTSEAFYETAFHEMTHSTGHKTRLNRFEDNSVAAFGSEDYSKEELVAEIGSASMANMLGIATEKTERNNAAYIQSWLRKLKDDVKFIVSAAGKAEKAVNYILNAVKAEDDSEPAIPFC